ncbi:MAG: hypothetical protein IJ588_04190 [Prevotella sp.]|nr:hypothetical protein [Prevotella sp.]
MKKLMILAAAAMMLTACGNKAKNTATDADSLAADSVAASQPAAITDTAAVKDAITAQVEAIFEYINQYHVEGGYSGRDNDTDQRFATKDWQEAVAAVDKADEGREGEQGFWDAIFPDVYSYWTMEYEGPVEVSDIDVKAIRTDGRAHVDFMLSGEGKEAQEVGWDLMLQGDQWRVKAILKDSRNMLAEMHHYIDLKKFYFGDKFDIHDYYADMNKQARDLLDPEAGILIGDYSLFDIDRDGTPEVLVRCPDLEAIVVFSIANGHAKWLAYAEGNSTLEFYEHGVGSIGGCGTGCRQSRFVLIKDSQSVNVFSHHEEFDPEGNLSDDQWESEKGDISTEEGERLFQQLGFSSNFEPDWLYITTE